MNNDKLTELAAIIAAQKDFIAHVEGERDSVLARAKKAEAERDVLIGRITYDYTFHHGFEFEGSDPDLSSSEAEAFVLAWAAQEAAKREGGAS